MQRFILENQGLIQRKLSNPAPKIKDLALFCQTGIRPRPPITKTLKSRQPQTPAAANLGPLSGNNGNMGRCRLGLKQRG